MGGAVETFLACVLAAGAAAEAAEEVVIRDVTADAYRMEFVDDGRHVDVLCSRSGLNVLSVTSVERRRQANLGAASSAAARRSADSHSP